MTTSTAQSNPIRRLARSQSPLTIALELLFALLIVAAFWYSRAPGFFAERVPAPLPEALVDGQPSPLTSADSPSLARLVGFDPTGQECRQLVANGSFEQVGDWQLPLSPRPPAYTDEQASQGSRSLRLGIGPNDQLAYGDSQASQTLDLPADADSLVLLADVRRTAASAGQDRQYAQVRVGEERHTLFDDSLDLPDWQPVAYDLTLLAGSRVELIFGVLNSGGPGRAAMGVDNVRLYACKKPSVAAVTTAAESRTQSVLLLPLIYLMRAVTGTEPTPTPTATPTSTATPALPATCAELVANGGFESAAAGRSPIRPGPDALPPSRSGPASAAWAWAFPPARPIYAATAPPISGSHCPQAQPKLA